MTEAFGDVRESTTLPRVEALPMSHVSLELGHLYYEDLMAGPDAIAAMFSALAPWAVAAVGRISAGEPSARLRTSTCFLVDDYFSDFAGPAEVVPMILAAAAKADLRIDYLAKESACAEAHGRRPAELVLNRLVNEPPIGATGSRPPVTVTGWLSNGERSPATAPAEAMQPVEDWQPPHQTAARRHSIFVDVELFSDEAGVRIWSCPMLSAVWQLLRLGMLRDLGQPVAQPVAPPDVWPENWSELASVTRLNPQAEPFSAYKTISLLSPRFMQVELAVRTILGQFLPEPAVVSMVEQRAKGERVDLVPEMVDRIQYAFVAPGAADPV